MRDALSIVRERAKQHAEDLDAATWLTVSDLAARWRVSRATVRAIPRDVLPFKEFGGGQKLHRRRYHPATVAAYEADGRVPGAPHREDSAA